MAVSGTDPKASGTGNATPHTLRVAIAADSAVAPKQSTGVPDNDDTLTAAGTVFTLASGEVGFIQNLGTDALLVKYGPNCAADSYSLSLGCGLVEADGKGDAVLIDDFIGEVSVYAGSPVYIAWKRVLVAP